MNALPELKGLFKGPVLIFASGPSALDVPLDVLNKINILTVNGAVQTLLRMNVKPLVYVFNDGYFVENNIDLIKSAIDNCKYVLMPKTFHQMYFSSYEGNIFYINRVNRDGRRLPDRVFSLSKILDKELVCSFSLLSKNKNRIGFSKDINKGYFCGRTIPYLALQVAYYLGFNTVFFAGLDLNGALGRFYDTGSTGLETTLDNDYEKYILPSFLKYKKNIESKNFKAYNLSEYSRLDSGVVNKVDVNFLKLACEKVE